MYTRGVLLKVLAETSSPESAIWGVIFVVLYTNRVSLKRQVVTQVKPDVLLGLSGAGRIWSSKTLQVRVPYGGWFRL